MPSDFAGGEGANEKLSGKDFSALQLSGIGGAENPIDLVSCEPPQHACRSCAS